MTLEDAVKWCVEERIEVLFYTLDKPMVIIYEPGDYGDREFLGRGETLIEAVQEAMKRGPRIEGAAFYKRMM